MGIGLLIVVKFVLAGALDLYSDEIFYWFASTRPALAYSDLPAMTALLAGLGSSLDSGNALATRLPFILMGSSIPGLIYWLALPITGTKQALQAAALTICIPLGGFLGLLAVPDVPLLFFGLLAIGFFERSLRTDKTSCWILTGVTVALGLSTHYRFLLYPAAASVILLAFRPERKQWANPRFWLAVLLAAVGLIPVIWVNMQNQLASASFYFVDRHPWEFQASGLLHLFKQAGAVSPPLYIIFVMTLWQLLLRARDGNREAALLLSFAATNLLVYLLLAPWTDATSTSLHWPLSGYFPLLVFAPQVLESLYLKLAQRFKLALARRLVLAIPLLGFCGSLVALAGVGSQAYQLPLQAVVGKGVLSNKMAGWSEFSQHTRTVLNENFSGQLPLVVTDNYYTGAQLEFAGVTTDVITVDSRKAVSDGRITQLQIWDIHRSGLQRYLDSPVLFITEDSTLNIPDKQLILAEMCQYVDSLASLDQLSLFNGDKRFSYYRGNRVLYFEPSPEYRATPCPFPAWGWIDSPATDAVMNGLFQIQGWAYQEDIGLEAVYLLLDNKIVADLNYGVHRPDVAEAMQVQSDPNAPDLGYSYQLDTRQFANGEYTVAIRMIDRTGVASEYGERRVSIRN